MSKLKVGITVGDINGIGLEVILKTFNDERLLELCTPIIYGSSKVVSYHKNIVKLDDLKFVSIKDASQAQEGQINVVNCWQEVVNINLGQISEEAGKYAQIALEQAVSEIMEGWTDALITAPINKAAMKLAGFPYPGHTEFLAAKSGAKEPVMLLNSEDLRIAVVTGHIPVSKVASSINREAVLRKLNILVDSLRRDFGIFQPKIAILGLNPHAGDEGAIGNEEAQHIIPVIQQMQKQGLLVYGPYPADGFFGSRAYTKFDAILAMYHDQGLVPFKTLAFGGGVNFTAGLPFVRTSPDHGTGFDIAGQNLADESSFRSALFAALDFAKNRKSYKEMTANPLGVQKVDDEELNRNGEPDGVVR